MFSVIIAFKPTQTMLLTFLNFSTTVPYPLSWEYTELLPTVPDRTSSSNGINMAVCLLSYTDAQAILQPVLKSRRRLPSSDRNTYTQTIEWTKFERWDRANEPSTGQHTGKYFKATL